MAKGQFPETITYYELIAIQAARRASRCGGGFRLWTWAKALEHKNCNHEAKICKGGLGMIRRDELRAYVLSLGVSPRNWQRWMIEARNNDMLMDIQKGSEWWLILPSAGRVALAIGLDSVGSKARMSATDLLGTGWKARVYSAWEHEKQISNEQIQKTLNISVYTQRHRRNQAGTIRQRNYSKSAMKADKLSGIKEYTKHKAPYVMRDGFIAWRLPDTRFSTHAERAGKGRSRKANRFIRMQKQSALSQMRQGLCNEFAPREFIRLFNLTEAQRQASERKINRHDIRVIELYQRAEVAKTGAVFWNHCPTM